jgi:hypothetical protein
MTKTELDSLLASYSTGNNQLYNDLYTGLSWSWNNYTQDMFDAVSLYSNGNKGGAFQLIRNNTQGHNPSAQREWDLGAQLFDEGFWLIMMTSATGILNWSEVSNWVDEAFHHNLFGLQRANSTWGSGADGPADLPTTLSAFAKLMVATVPTDGSRLLFTKEAWGALRGGFSADPVQLFAIVHQYIPAT